jgi:hypothetical protein
VEAEKGSAPRHGSSSPKKQPLERSSDSKVEGGLLNNRTEIYMKDRKNAAL